MPALDPSTPDVCSYKASSGCCDCVCPLYTNIPHSTRASLVSPPSSCLQQEQPRRYTDTKHTAKHSHLCRNIFTLASIAAKSLAESWLEGNTLERRVSHFSHCFDQMMEKEMERKADFLCSWSQRVRPMVICLGLDEQLRARLSTKPSVSPAPKTLFCVTTFNENGRLCN